MLFRRIMARHSAQQHCCPAVSSSMKSSLLALAAAILLLTVQGVWSQRVRVEEEVEAFPTESVDLRCQFIDGGGSTKLTQVSWIWEPVEGQRDNIAVFHPIYGQSFPDSPFKDRVVFIQGSLENPSIRISRLSMADAGRYTCEYATYPSGNEQGTTNLVMLAKPKNSAVAVTVQAGAKPVVVARCEAVGGKPPASIRWEGSAGGNHSTRSEPAADGTVTVRSEYRLAPTPADHGREVSCTVSQKTQDRPWVFPVKLSVEYPPTVSIEGYDNNWYVGRSDAVLICQANANPAPTTVTWTAVSGPMPDTVMVEGNRLTVRKVDDAVNTTFVCEVKNRVGVSKHQVTTVVIEALADPSSAGMVAGAVIGSLLALLSVVGLVAALLTRSRRRQRRGYPANGDSVTSTGSGGGGGGAGSGGHKARLLGFAGSPGDSGKNGTGGSGGGGGGGGGNNNGPIYTYREGCDATGTLTEKANDYHHPHHHHPHHLHSVGSSTPTAHDVLLGGDAAEAERRRKFNDSTLDDSMEDEEEDEEERYDRFGGGVVVMGGGGGGGGVGGGGGGSGSGMTAPAAYHLRRGRGEEPEEEEVDAYLDDDMESQRDGSVISRTAIYV